MNIVDSAYARATANNFGRSCDPAVGRLLATLAAGLPSRARVLEIGTGVGVGTAWIVSGLLPRTDVSVTSIESDEATAAIARSGQWPAFVEFKVNDALDYLETPGEGFDLIFADASGGKTEGLDRTLANLNPRGTLIVDDMTPVEGWPEDFRVKQDGVRRALLADPGLVAVELAHGTGVIIGVRRPPAG
ncbi:class I SAM-dependent methyltransferase [Dactylosporangium vinaceum]|uniref:O-methyltransferase n=1 Tax=Dactylosporangium vinaceum TaxID=53362 RepID=A0ABV5MH97_9ACTN|nr:class I SAM-dependent methyltransferase [Dactylosporangium vinaceum]UAB94819.1 class I SAM-dependent methyltransferase [Dactylosporangium vinaceum]